MLQLGHVAGPSVSRIELTMWIEAISSRMMQQVPTSPFMSAPMMCCNVTGHYS